MHSICPTQRVHNRNHHPFLFFIVYIQVFKHSSIRTKLIEDKARLQQTLYRVYTIYKLHQYSLLSLSLLHTNNQTTLLLVDSSVAYRIACISFLSAICAPWLVLVCLKEQQKTHSNLYMYLILAPLCGDTTM